MTLEDGDSKARNKRLDKQYSLDYGLVDISTVGQEDKKMSLPNSVEFDPGEGKIEEKLKKVLQVKTLRNMMIKLMCPKITDRSIITPHHFRMKIVQVAELFKADENDINYELYSEIRDLLMSEEEKCELLDQYRHMLLMG
ncbi:MAG: hypothetical protein K2L13_02905 [Opitutales bacterium]|nr:hypothetical protein [Opitutales bacterium]